MHSKGTFMKVISIIILVTFIFTNSTQALVPDVFSRQHLAPPSGSENVSPEELAEAVRAIRKSRTGYDGVAEAEPTAALAPELLTTTTDGLAEKGVSVSPDSTMTVTGDASGVGTVGSGVVLAGANLSINEGTVSFGDNVTITGPVGFDGGNFTVASGTSIDGNNLPDDQGAVYFAPGSATFQQRQENLFTRYREFMVQRPEAPLQDRLAVLTALLWVNFWGLKGSPQALIVPLAEVLAEDSSLRPDIPIAQVAENLAQSLAVASGHCAACGSMVAQSILGERLDVEPDVGSESFGLLMVTLDALRNNGEVLMDPNDQYLQNSAWAVSNVLGYTAYKCEPADVVAELGQRGFLAEGQFPVVVEVGKKGPDGEYYDHWVYLTFHDDQLYVIDDGNPILASELGDTIVFTGNFLIAEEETGRLPEAMRMSEQEMLSVRAGCALSGVSAESATIEGWLQTNGKPLDQLTTGEIFALLHRQAARMLNLHTVSRRIIGRLEPRGYDNFADARKYVIPLDPDLLGETIGKEINTYEDLPQPLRDYIARAEQENRQDVIVLTDENGRPMAIRFFAISRGVGSATTNAELIEMDMQRRVGEVARLLYGDDTSVFYCSSTGCWGIHKGEGLRRENHILLEADPRHTRFKTKGGDRKENAHYWTWKGMTLGHNGDFETYNVFKPVLQSMGETFEGTTDSEVLLHVVADMAEDKDADGRVIGRVDSATAVTRAFRLIEKIEALSRASEVLIDPKNQYPPEVKSKLSTALQELGIPVGDLMHTETVSGQEIPILVNRLIRIALSRPQAYDSIVGDSNPNGYIVVGVAGGRTVGLGDYLKNYKTGADDQTGLGKAKGVFGRGLNISISVLSLYDDDNMVVARTHAESTNMYVGIGRNKKGDIEIVEAGSETKGFAPEPEIGIKEESVEVVEGVVRVTRGRVEQIAVPEWSVISVRGTKIRQKDVLTDEDIEDPDTEITYVSWKEVIDEEQYRQRSAFEWESRLQGVTVGFTLDSLTRKGREVDYELNLEKVDNGTMLGTLDEADPLLLTPGLKSRIRAAVVEQDRVKAGDLIGELLEYRQAKLGTWNPGQQESFGSFLSSFRKWTLQEGLDKDVAANLHSSAVAIIGSGTSENGIRMVDAEGNYFDYCESSDDARFAWPAFLKKGSTLVIVSQSGETGVAKNIAEQAQERGVNVVVITNRRGSSLYRTGRTAGGVIVTESIDEDAVAATGSNSCQIVAMRLLGLLRERNYRIHVAKEEPTEVDADISNRITDMYRQASRREDNLTQAGLLQRTYDRFQRGGTGEADGEGVNHRKLREAGILQFLRGSYGGIMGMRGANVFAMGIGERAQMYAHEAELKITEISRRAVKSFLPSRFFASGFSDGDPSERPLTSDWNPSQSIDTLRENLKKFTGGEEDDLGIGNVPKFEQLPTVEDDGKAGKRTDDMLKKISEIVILGDGEDTMTMSYLQEKYKAIASVPVKSLDYHQRVGPLRKGALVVAIQPWTREQKNLLNRLRGQGARVFILENETPIAENRLGVEASLKETAVEDGRLIATVGKDPRVAQTVTLDLFLMEIMRRRGERTDIVDYRDAQVIAREIDELKKQIGGMNDVLESFTRQDSVVNNYTELRRLAAYARERGRMLKMGWGNFDTWSTGKGTHKAIADDLATLMTAYLGRGVVSEDTNNFSHGWYGAVHYGDLMFVQLIPKGAPGHEDVKKKAVDEVIPRAMNYPYPVFGDQEPGLLAAVAKGDETDRSLANLARHLSDDEYRDLRQKRHQSIDDESTRRPDVVFTTTNGGFFERYAVNRMVVQGLQYEQTRMAEETRRWEESHPNNVMVVFDLGEKFVGRQQMYKDLRARLSKKDRSKIVVIAAEGVSVPEDLVDEILWIPSDDALSLIPVGHRLTEWMARDRFQQPSEFLVKMYRAIQADIDDKEHGILNGPEYQDTARGGQLFRTPSELFAHYGHQDPKAVAALHALRVKYEHDAEYGDAFVNFTSYIARCVNIDNIDPFMAIGLAAQGIDRLLCENIDKPGRLAKVTTNLSAIRLSRPRTAPIRFAHWDFDNEDPDAVVENDQRIQQLANDEEAVEELREIVADTFGASELEGLDTGEAVVRKYLELAKPVLLAAQRRVRQQYPGFTRKPTIVLELGNDRLAHRYDGVLAINVHAVRNARLCEAEFEHEVLHEIETPQEVAISVPADITVDHSVVRKTLGELFIIENELSRNFTYSAEEQASIDDVLTGPNVVDEAQAFFRLLSSLRGPGLDVWDARARILAFMRGRFPELEEGIEALAQAVETPEGRRFMEVALYELKANQNTNLTPEGIKELAKARPSGFISRRPTTSFMASDAEQENNRSRIQYFKTMGVTIEGDENDTYIGKYVRIERGATIKRGAVLTGNTWVEADAEIGVASVVHDGFISQGAKVPQGAEVTNATVGKDSEIIMASVRSAAVGENSLVRDSLVETTADYDEEDWGYDDMHTVTSHQTVIGPNCELTGLADVMDSQVSEAATVEGGMTTACEVGPNSAIINAKAILVRAGAGTVVNPIYPDGKRAVTELMENFWGAGYESFGPENYEEGLVDNVIVDPETGDVYWVAAGDMAAGSLILSSFTGTLGLKGYDSTRRPQAFSSAHAHFRREPCSRYGNRCNIVALPETPSAFDFGSINATVMAAGSVVGGQLSEEPVRPVTHSWGITSGRSIGQSLLDEDYVFSIYTSPNIFARAITDMLDYHNNEQNRANIITEIEVRKRALLAQGFSEEELAHFAYNEDFNGLARAILRGRVARLRALLAAIQSGELAVRAEIRAQVEERLTAAIEMYQRHVDSDLWNIVQDDSGNWKLEKWEWQSTQWAADEVAGRTVIADPNACAQYAANGLIYSAGAADWSADEFYKEDVDNETYTARRYATNPVSGNVLAVMRRTIEDYSTPEAIADIRQRYGHLENVIICPGVRIDEGVEIEAGTPERPTVILPGSILRKGTKVESGAVVRANARNTTFGRNGNYDFVYSTADAKSRVIFEEGTNYRGSRFEAKNGKTITLKAKSHGQKTNVLAEKENVVIGEKTTLFAYSTIIDSTIGARSLIGCWVENSNLGDGFTAQHLSIRIFNTDAPNTTVVSGVNIGAAAMVGSPGGERVYLAPGIFVGSHARVAAGTRAGELCYIVGAMEGPAELAPLTFCRDGRIIKAGVVTNNRLAELFALRFGFGYHKRYAVSPETDAAVDRWVEGQYLRLAGMLLQELGDHIEQTPKGTYYKVKEDLLTSLATHTARVIDFISRDITAGPDTTVDQREERIAKRALVFGDLVGVISSARQEFAGTPEVFSMIENIEAVCMNLQDGRFRMRNGELTDVVWFNRSADPTRPNMKAIPITNENIRMKTEIARDEGGFSVNELRQEDDNVTAFETRMKALDGVAEEQIGLAVSARTILEHIGGRRVLSNLSRMRTKAGAPLFKTIVYTENAADKLVIEHLEFPGVESVMQLTEDEIENPAAKIERVKAALLGLGIKDAKHIGMIETPAKNAEKVAAELKVLAPDIYIGVPSAPRRGQLLSTHAVFLDVIDAVTTERRETVFAIALPPIETPTTGLQDSFEEYREAIEFLRNA